MTQITALGTRVPQWTLGDRLRKARTTANLSQQELADEIGISRRSVTSYELEVQTPSRPVLLSWAIRAQVSHDWLATGIEAPDGPDDPSTIDLTQAKPSSAWVTAAEIIAFPAQQAA